MANYAIMRIEKRKLPSVGRINKHHERLKEEYKSNPDIDRGRTGMNYHIIAPSLPYRDAVLARIEQAGARRRKDSVVLQDCFVGGTPDWLKAKSREEQREYFSHAYQFFEDNFGKENIISAVVHMDEATPHMHLCFVPITKEGKQTMLGNQKSLSEWQTAYHARMSARWPELERGESSMITKRKHIPTWLFKLGGRLDKQHDEIVKALSDINAFNAGKKRDRALALLSAWLPDMEKFSREIQKQSDYIDSLKQRVSQSEQYADRLREGRYAEELKVQEANKRIFELQRTNQQLERLVKLIPPEVLAELQKGGRNRPRGR